MRLIPVLFLALGSCVAARAADNALLLQVANRWFDERGHWAFTEHVREFQGKTLKQERVERYDPSMRPVSRWQLLAINGHKPSPAEWSDWLARKNRKHGKRPKDIDSYFDFAKARVLDETADAIRYELPLRGGVEWLFPINKVELLVTIDKRPPALREVHARISEPMRVALGLAHVLNINLDFQMDGPVSPDPADAKPSGSAEAVVTKLGDRVEYSWSDFTRVTPHAETEE
ncbi:MAG TPA: hypothetical protein VHE13_08890 [Opitutus sp.]|nr:hypothetical protein [Opitutus sp.]